MSMVAHLTLKIRSLEVLKQTISALEYKFLQNVASFADKSVITVGEIVVPNGSCISVNRTPDNKYELDDAYESDLIRSQKLEAQSTLDKIKQEYSVTEVKNMIKEQNYELIEQKVLANGEVVIKVKHGAF